MYQEFLDELMRLQDVKYRDFHKSLVLNSKYQMIGVRTPLMREIAKRIAKENGEEFLKCAQDTYYEEVMIQGLVIAQFKEEELFDCYFPKHIEKIDNWALCDTFCSALKIVEKREEKYFPLALKLALEESEFKSRVGLVMILNHFLHKENLEHIFDVLNRIESDKLYVNMAQAWLVCEMYIKFPSETQAFLKKNCLNVFTQNKAISKIHDSYRVSEEEKVMLRQYRK